MTVIPLTKFTRAGLEKLSPREKEIFELIVSCLSNQEIGEKLFISRGTVETHVKHIRQKLGVKNKLELCKVAIENNLVQIAGVDLDIDTSEADRQFDELGKKNFLVNQMTRAIEGLNDGIERLKLESMFTELKEVI